jgi:CarD family transcriptional regulator
MFKKGETVYYGTAGVCKVNDICRSPFDPSDERMYYVLEPSDFNVGTIIYAPADNDRVLLRSLMTEGEAHDLISSIPTLPTLEISNEKQRREEYRNAMKDGTPEAIVRLIKTIYIRKIKGIKDKRRISDTDTDFDKVARRALLGELCAVLGTPADEIESLINSEMKKA